MILLFFIVDGLVCGMVGFAIGRISAEQELKERRSELGLGEEPEDPYDKLFK
jgi:hypothetical protein